MCVKKSTKCNVFVTSPTALALFGSASLAQQQQQQQQQQQISRGDRQLDFGDARTSGGFLADTRSVGLVRRA